MCFSEQSVFGVKTIKFDCNLISFNRKQNITVFHLCKYLSNKITVPSTAVIAHVWKENINKELDVRGGVMLWHVGISSIPHAPRKDEKKSRKSNLCSDQNHLSVAEKSTSNMIRKQENFFPLQIIVRRSDQLRINNNEECRKCCSCLSGQFWTNN